MKVYEEITNCQTLISSISGIVIDKNGFVSIIFPEMLHFKVVYDFSKSVKIQINNGKVDLPIRKPTFLTEIYPDGGTRVAFSASYPLAGQKQIHQIQLGDRLRFIFGREVISSYITIREDFESGLAQTS